MTVGRIFTKNIYLYIFILGFFSKTGKTRVSHQVEIMTRWPDVKDDPNDPLTQWTNDPVPCLVPVAVRLVANCYTPFTFIFTFKWFLGPHLKRHLSKADPFSNNKLTCQSAGIRSAFYTTSCGGDRRTIITEMRRTLNTDKLLNNSGATRLPTGHESITTPFTVSAIYLTAVFNRATP